MSFPYWAQHGSLARPCKICSRSERHLVVTATLPSSFPAGDTIDKEVLQQDLFQPECNLVGSSSLQSPFPAGKRIGVYSDTLQDIFAAGE